MGRRVKRGEGSPRRSTSPAKSASNPAVGEAPALLHPPRGRVRTEADRRERLAFLQALAAARGGKCLSWHYASTMTWSCAQGHEWEAKPHDVLRGQWCQRCALAYAHSRSRARGFARVQEIARQHGGACLSEAYTSVDELLRWRCAKGHEWEATANKIRHRSWCPECLAEPKVRLSIEDMKACAHERGGECLSSSYTDPTIPLRWRCAEGHEWDALPEYVRLKGTWCPRCARPLLKELAQVQADARALDGELLSPSFLGVVKPHRYRCRLGHEFETLPARVALGQWCSRCGQNVAHDLERLREAIARRGGEIVSEQCGKSSDRIRVRCGKGHEWETRQSNLMSGSWCRKCANEAKTGRPMPRLTLADMQAAAAKRGGECLSEHYVSSSSKLSWRCRLGHEWDTTPAQIRSGSWCPVCANKTRGTIDAIRAIALDHGGECISEKYQNHKDVLRFRCGAGHLFTAKGTAIKSGAWCPTCDPNHAPAATAAPQPQRRRPVGRSTS